MHPGIKLKLSSFLENAFTCWASFLHGCLPHSPRIQFRGQDKENFAVTVQRCRIKPSSLALEPGRSWLGCWICCLQSDCTQSRFIPHSGIDRFFCKVCAVTSHFQNALQPMLTKPVHFIKMRFVFVCIWLTMSQNIGICEFFRPTQQQLIVCLGGDETLGGHVSSFMITDIDI